MDFALVGNEALTIGMFVILFVGFGLMLASLTERLDTRLPAAGAEPSRVTSALYLLTVPAGLLASVVLLLFYLADNEVETTTGFRPDPAQVVLGVLLLALLLVTLYQRLSPLVPRLGQAGPRLRLAGQTLMLAAVAVGGYQAALDIADIV